MPMNEWEKKFNDDQIKHDKDMIKWWEERKKILQRRGDGASDPAHPLLPQGEKIIIGRDEGKVNKRIH